MKKWLPWIIVAIFACLRARRSVVPKRDKDFAWQQFGRIPVMANGRFQPLDSLARNSLLQLREKAAAHFLDRAAKGRTKQRTMPRRNGSPKSCSNPKPPRRGRISASITRAEANARAARRAR